MVYNREQILEINIANKLGICVDFLLNPQISWIDMNKIRKWLKSMQDEGYDITRLKDYDFSASTIVLIVELIELENIGIIEYLSPCSTRSDIEGLVDIYNRGSQI